MFRLTLSLLLPATLLAQAPTWHTDYDAAKALAAKSGKPLLVDFTGTDWCPYCVLLEKEVLKTPAFEAWAGKVVLLKLDYPTRAGRTEEKLKADPSLARRMALKDQFKITGFPTVILMDPEGRELNRLPGFTKGTAPEAWIAQLEKTSRN